MLLYQAVYSFVLTQIQFGYYGYGENLPAMEELCRLYHISIDSVAPVYHQLRNEGYISHAQRSGARVRVKFGAGKTNQHIQRFFADRKASLLDLNQSLWPLFGWAQWLSLKHAPQDTANQIEQLPCGEKKPPNIFWRQLELKYGALGNDILTRLTRYIYLFFQGPFYSVKNNGQYIEDGLCTQQGLAEILRRGDWGGLKDYLYTSQERFSDTFLQFYEREITEPPPEDGVAFRWDAYKKSSQLRYTLAIELLKDISRGVYPEGSFLPPAEQLAAEKGVSISTVRRTVSLLNVIGAVKSSRPYGACVIPPAQSTENCDFTKPDMKRRLIDLMASLQIFALSAKAVSRITLASLDEGAISLWKERLCSLQNGQRYELVTYLSLELISELAPYQTIRVIYSELLRLLFWGNPLRGMRGDPASVSRFFAPYYNRMLQSLETGDGGSYSAMLEELLLHELQITIEGMIQMGIREVGTILIPGKDDIWE